MSLDSDMVWWVGEVSNLPSPLSGAFYLLNYFTHSYGGANGIRARVQGLRVPVS